jgi:uroporphyrinogen-III synthase
MRLIVTRPEPDATRTAQALIRLGHAAILSPMLDISRAKDARFPKELFQAVLITSSNAARMLAGHPDRSLIADAPIFAVGDRSALEARRAGFRNVRSASGTMEDLAGLAVVELSPAGGPLLYAAGEVQAGDLAGVLSERGFTVHTSVLYRAEPRARLSGVATDALQSGGVDGILFYSRRSAEAFSAALRTQGLTPLGPVVTCFCLAAAVAEPLATIATGPVRVADQPTQLSLFALIERASEAR